MKVNEAIWLEGNATTLFSVTQLREFGITVKDIAKQRGGDSNSILPDDTKIPLELTKGLLTVLLRSPD